MDYTEAQHDTSLLRLDLSLQFVPIPLLHPHIPPYGSVDDYAQQYDGRPMALDAKLAMSAVSDDAFSLQDRREYLRTFNLPSQEPPPKSTTIHFEEYVSRERVEPGLGTRYYSGTLRINHRSPLDAYVTAQNQEPADKDILVYGRRARNRALDGDVVVLELVDSRSVLTDRQEAYVRRQWERRTDGSVPGDPEPIDPSRRCGKVVFILKERRIDAIIGYLSIDRPSKLPNPPRWSVGDYVWLKPIFGQNPLVQMMREDLPVEYIVEPERFTDRVFSVRIKAWDCDAEFPVGAIRKMLGRNGEVSTQDAYILEFHGINTDEFSDECLAVLPPDPWILSDEERSKRTDFTGHTVFTIDPSTARDLDDAIHIRHMGENRYEMGVHIADVGHFVHPGTPLFDRILDTSTTVYLVGCVYPMLPRRLSEDLCSLNPNVERLTFSVCWDVYFDVEIGTLTIGEPRFSKSYIRSKCKLSYEQAQDVIDGKQISSEDCPEDVQSSIVLLHKVTQVLRQRRLAEGALSLINNKRSFVLGEGNIPLAVRPYSIYDSNRLIEELMILANISAAETIYDCFPKDAIVRRHRAPTPEQLSQIKSRLESIGISLDTSTSHNLQRSLDAIQDEVLRTLTNTHCVRSMNRAEYICTANIEHETDMYHYGLATPLYTHFTSPIRRAPDILVHMLLNAVITGSDFSSHGITKSVDVIAQRCTQAKLDADRAYEASSDLYLAHFLNVKVPPNRAFEGYVVFITDKSINVCVPCFGLDVEVKYESFCIHPKANELNSAVQFTWIKTNTRGSLRLLGRVSVTIFTQLDGAVAIFGVVPVDRPADEWEDTDRFKFESWEGPLNGTD